MFDFDVRQVDPQIGRFTGIDPHADRYVAISPFASINNSPVNTIDPDGKDVRVVKDMIRIGYLCPQFISLSSG
jgi:hypothetical protein